MPDNARCSGPAAKSKDTRTAKCNAQTEMGRSTRLGATKVQWMVAAIADMVEFGETTAGELSVNNRSGKNKSMHGKGLLDVVLYKQELLHRFLNTFIDTRAIPAEEKAMAKTAFASIEPEPRFLRVANTCDHMRTHVPLVPNRENAQRQRVAGGQNPQTFRDCCDATKVFASHADFRSRYSGMDLSWLGNLSPVSNRVFTLIEETIFVAKFDRNIVQALRLGKAVEDLLGDEPLIDKVTEIDDLLRAEAEKA